MKRLKLLAGDLVVVAIPRGVCVVNRVVTHEVPDGSGSATDTIASVFPPDAVGWTDPLLAPAQTIVWLDHVAWRRSSQRMVRRFVRQALAEARNRRGRERFLRFRDYARRVSDLAKAIPEARRYSRNASSNRAEPSRAATERALGAHEKKVIHCRSAADVDAALGRLSLLN